MGEAASQLKDSAGIPVRFLAYRSGEVLPRTLERAMTFVA
jgi:hypothetical protein